VGVRQKSLTTPRGYRKGNSCGVRCLLLPLPRTALRLRLACAGYENSKLNRMQYKKNIYFFWGFPKKHLTSPRLNFTLKMTSRLYRHISFGFRRNSGEERYLPHHHHHFTGNELVISFSLFAHAFRGGEFCGHCRALAPKHFSHAFRLFSHAFRPFSHALRPFSHAFRPFSHALRLFSHAFRPFSHAFRPFSHAFRPFSHAFRPFSHAFRLFSHAFRPFSHALRPFSHAFRLFSHALRPFSHARKGFPSNCFFTLIY
jgi:hypothetical protein